MFYPPNFSTSLDLHTPPVLVDPRVAIADLFSMSHPSLPTGQDNLYVNHDQYQHLHDDPQKYLHPESAMRRQSWSSSTFTATTCTTTAFSNHPPPLPPPPSIIVSSSHAGLCNSAAAVAAACDSDNATTAVDAMQDKLDTLYDEWISVDIVYRSLQTAFPVRPLVHLTHEERLEDIDRELSIAYDDLMTQVRRLYRNLNRLSREMAQYNNNIQQQQQELLQQQQQQSLNVYATPSYYLPPSTGFEPTPP